MSHFKPCRSRETGNCLAWAVLLFCGALTYSIAGGTQEPGASPAPAADDFEQGMLGAAAGGASALACDQERCEKAGLSFLIMAGSVDVLAVIIGVLIWWISTRKLWWSSTVRFIVPAAVISIGAMVVIALNPFADEVLRCCLMTADMARYVLLSDIAPWPKGVVVGALPTFGVFFLFFLVRALVVNLTRR